MEIRKIKRIHLGCMLFVGCILVTAAQMLPTREYQVKAVFLYNFTQFVKWPENSFETSDAPFIIGILGEDPFGTYADQAVLGEYVDEHPLIINRYGNIMEAKDCHILFISSTATEQEDSVFHLLAQYNILTVGDAEDFIDRGGMIKFIIQNEKIRMQINMPIIKKSKLKISSKLLRVSDIIKETK